MNFQSIKTKFLLHLKEITPSFDTGVMSLDSSDESIFSHAQEFKEFIKQEYNITDSSLMSMSINDIMEKDIVDGKLVEAGVVEVGQEEQTQETNEASQEEIQTTEQAAQETAEQEEENTLVADIIGGLFEVKT